jgi:hypothetical protein
VARTTVRNVDVVARLKARAKRRVAYARALADRIRRRLAGRPHTDSVELLAEDRAR